LNREWVELVTGDKFWSDDHWITAWKLKGLYGERVEGKALDRVRYIALVAYGGGRDDVDDKREGAGPVGRNAKKGGAR